MMHYNKFRTGEFKRAGWIEMSETERYALSQNSQVLDKSLKLQQGKVLDHLVDMARITVLCVIPAARPANNAQILQQHIQYKN